MMYFNNERGVTDILLSIRVGRQSNSSEQTKSVEKPKHLHWNLCIYGKHLNKKLVVIFV